MYVLTKAQYFTYPSAHDCECTCTFPAFWPCISWSWWGWQWLAPAVPQTPAAGEQVWQVPSALLRNMAHCHRSRTPGEQGERNKIADQVSGQWIWSISGQWSVDMIWDLPVSDHICYWYRLHWEPHTWGCWPLCLQCTCKQGGWWAKYLWILCANPVTWSYEHWKGEGRGRKSRN